MSENLKQFPIKSLQTGQQIQIDLKDTPPRVCECGCMFFVQVMKVYILSALLSPTGQELVVQQPVLSCMECKKVL